MYQRLQCTDNYFFKIKFVFFLYLLLSASWKENDVLRYISVIRQTVGYRTPVFFQPFSWHVHIAITYNLPHLRLWYVDVVPERGEGDTGSCLPNNSDVRTRKRRSMFGIDMIRNNRIPFRLHYIKYLTVNHNMWHAWYMQKCANPVKGSWIFIMDYQSSLISFKNRIHNIEYRQFWRSRQTLSLVTQRVWKDKLWYLL